jgi:serine phosphatase RsbU (regulator of sigma subunit)
VLRNNGDVEEVGRLGTALAMFDKLELFDTTIELASGELLCVFTDGLVEARRSGEFFGSARLADLLRQHGHLPVDELATVLDQAARAFHGGQLTDDLALLLFRSRTPAGAAAPAPATP